jgi:hypothetical protein
MLDQLERDLVRALAEASRVPTPDDLAARVERRARVRRRRRFALLLLAAPVLLLPAMSTPTADHPTPPHPSSAASPAASAVLSPVPVPTGPLKFPPSTSDAKPIEEVWPAGVLRMPAGSPFSVGRLLDRDHALMRWNDLFEHTAAIYSYDLRTQAKAKLADLADPPGTRDYFIQDFALTATEILWWARSADATYVWSLPRTGGTPVLVARLAGALELSGMNATDDAVYWSSIPTGVYRLDRRTRTAELMPGLEKFSFTQFPWASSLERSPLLHNVLTNQEIVVRAPADTSSLWCVPALCIGEGGPAFSHFAMRTNGSRRVDLMDADLSPGLIGGRYVLAMNRALGRQVLIDVETGTAAWLPGGGAEFADDTAVWFAANDTLGIFYPTRA